MVIKCDYKLAEKELSKDMLKVVLSKQRKMHYFVGLIMINQMEKFY